MQSACLIIVVTISSHFSYSSVEPSNKSTHCPPAKKLPQSCISSRLFFASSLTSLRISHPDECVESEVQTDCNRNKWRVALKPGGDRRAETPGYVAVFLFNENEDSVELDTRFVICVKDANGKIVVEKDCEFKLTPRGNGYGNLVIQCSRILEAGSNILKDGALRIDVTIQVKIGSDTLYQPPIALSERQLKLLISEERADISFNVGGKIFPAHSQIIYANAPILANYCYQHSQQNSSVSVEIIKDANPDVFRILLEHVYSGCLPSKESALKFGKELINAANKYELTDLKLAVENILVQERIIDKVNVSDYILFANAQSCALLEEYATSFFLLHFRELLRSDHSERLRESGELLSEIMLLMSDAHENEEAMTVTELRKELGKRELDVDGTKETLVSRLKEAKR
jgi:hypothetical protein